jgi:hypothetical protein
MRRTSNALEGTGRSGRVLTENRRFDQDAGRGRRIARRANPRFPDKADRAQTVVGDFHFYLDSQGRQHFNFVQRIWLYPSVQMALTPMMSRELRTLAVNLLTPVTRERDYSALVGVTSKSVMRLASRFCTECLLTADGTALLIPRSAIRAWLASRSRIQVPPSVHARASRRRRGTGVRELRR